MSCAEITAIGLPAVLVPYPYAADDHQRRNAQVLAGAGAARLILDRDLDGASLAAALAPLLDDSGTRATMAARSRDLGRPRAAADVAQVCIDVMRTSVYLKMAVRFGNCFASWLGRLGGPGGR